MKKMTEKPKVPDKIWLKYHGNTVYPSVFNREPKDYDAIFICKDEADKRVENDALVDLVNNIIDAINSQEYFHSVELLLCLKNRIIKLDEEDDRKT